MDLSAFQNHVFPQLHLARDKRRDSLVTQNPGVSPIPRRVGPSSVVPCSVLLCYTHIRAPQRAVPVRMYKSRLVRKARSMKRPTRLSTGVNSSMVVDRCMPHVFNFFIEQPNMGGMENEGSLASGTPRRRRRSGPHGPCRHG